MTDRRRIAGVLVVLGAALAVVASFQNTFSSVYRGFGSDLTITTTLWVTRSEPVQGARAEPAFYAAGLPVVVSALVMVAAVVLLLRERSAFAGRPLAAGGAGLLAGVVLLYVVQVRALEALITDQPPGPGSGQEVHYHGGMYLLVAAAIIGLVGAGLAQQRRPEPAAAADEDGVVVHRLDGDDATPPFGIAVPGGDEQREAR